MTVSGYLIGAVLNRQLRPVHSVAVTAAEVHTANENWLAVTKKERAALTSYRVQ